MFNKIKDRIKDKDLILFGELHGTKETPELLFKFFSKLAEYEDFNVCFEMPEEFQNNPREFFEDRELRDGRNSKEYFELIKNLKNLNEENNINIKIIFIAPSVFTSQEELENKMAQNIKKNLEGKKTFVITGDIHASKKSLVFGEANLKTAGSILFEELKDKLLSIRITPKRGEFFNFGVRKIDKTILDKNFNKNFDYVYSIEKVTPCSFFKKEINN